MRPKDPITTEMLDVRNEYLMLIGEITGVPTDDIMSSKRHEDIAMARHLLMWALYSLYGYTTMQIGAMTRRHHTTVTYAVNMVNNTHLPKKMEELKNKIKQYYKNKAICTAEKKETTASYWR